MSRNYWSEAWRRQTAVWAWEMSGKQGSQAWHADGSTKQQLVHPAPLLNREAGGGVLLHNHTCRERAFACVGALTTLDVKLKLAT